MACLINCYCYDCRFANKFDECKYGYGVVINDGGECERFEDYRDQPEFQHEYFTAVEMRLKNGKYGVFKKKSKGAKAEKYGVTFFYEAKFLEDNTWCTELTTGIAFRYRNISKVAEKIKNGNYARVEDLPEYEEGE